MEEEIRWEKKIKEIIRRAERYASARVRLRGSFKERASVVKLWNKERMLRVCELIRLGGL